MVLLENHLNGKGTFFFFFFENLSPGLAFSDKIVAWKETVAELNYYTEKFT